MAPTRIAPAFEAARGTTGLIPFLTAGYPSLEGSLAMMHALEREGALAIELGIPFSDPIADGPEIQRASEWALRAGVGTAEVLELVARYRGDSRLPVVVMTYANPILRVGIDEFARRAAGAGVDGIIVSDLPPDESPEVWEALDRGGLDTILLVAPTTAPERLALVSGRCRGFVYCLARTGVTGRSGGESGVLEERVAELRRHTTLPVAVGFGVSSGDDARRLRGIVDAVVVGAAFMRAIADAPADGERRVAALGAELVGALR